jgi:aminopeptidase C
MEYDAGHICLPVRSQLLYQLSYRGFCLIQIHLQSWDLKKKSMYFIDPRIIKMDSYFYRRLIA